MNTLFLNPATWDLMVDAEGNIAMAEAPYSTAQDVASACRLWSGEARYNITRGIPYENSILGKLPPMSLLASWYQKEVETVPEVAKAQAVSYTHLSSVLNERERKLAETVSKAESPGGYGSVARMKGDQGITKMTIAEVMAKHKGAVGRYQMITSTLKEACLLYTSRCV